MRISNLPKTNSDVKIENMRYRKRKVVKIKTGHPCNRCENEVTMGLRVCCFIIVELYFPSYVWYNNNYVHIV